MAQNNKTNYTAEMIDDMMIKDVAGRDIFGEDFTIELTLGQQDGPDLYILCGRGADGGSFYVSNKTLIHLFGDVDTRDIDYDKVRSDAMENYEIEIGYKPSYGDLTKSQFYKVFDFAAYIEENQDWTCFDESVAELAKEFVGKKVGDIEITGALDELLFNDEDEDEEDDVDEE